MFRLTFGLAAGLLGATAVFAPAGAADLQQQEVPSSGYNWSGFYVGAGLGAGAVVHEIDVPAGPFNLNGIGGEGIYGEVSVGYDHMMTDRFLLGVYASGRYGGIQSSLSSGGLSGDLTLDTGFDIGARAGMLITPLTLGYVLAGYSYQHFDVSAPGFSYDWDDSGFVLGTGLETVITDRLTAKVEYTYRQYGGDDLDSGGFAEISPSSHTVLFGLNYRFGGGAVPQAATFVAPAPDWTGFFISGAAGAAGLVHELSVPAAGLTANGLGAEGVFAALGVGYDHDFGNRMVLGIEARGVLSGVSTSLSVPGGTANVDADYALDVVARLGYKLNPSVLLYGLAGYSYGHFDINASGLGSVYDWNANGFVVGGGLETAITERLFAGIEYRYTGYEGEDFDFGGGTDLTVEPSQHAGQITLKYKF